MFSGYPWYKEPRMLMPEYFPINIKLLKKLTPTELLIYSLIDVCIPYPEDRQEFTLTNGDIANFLEKSKGGISKAISGLVKKGFVKVETLQECDGFQTRTLIKLK